MTDREVRHPPRPREIRARRRHAPRRTARRPPLGGGGRFVSAAVPPALASRQPRGDSGAHRAFGRMPIHSHALPRSHRCRRGPFSPLTWVAPRSGPLSCSPTARASAGSHTPRLSPKAPPPSSRPRPPRCARRWPWRPGRPPHAPVIRSRSASPRPGRSIRGRGVIVSPPNLGPDVPRRCHGRRNGTALRPARVP